MSMYSNGTNVEILRNSQWYAGVVVDSDDHEGEILVKYVEYNNKGTEWILFNRETVREVKTTINQKEMTIPKPVDVQIRDPSPVKPVIIQPIVIDEPPISLSQKSDSVMKLESPSKALYRVGDNVIAAWSKTKNVSARIEAVLPNNEYRVQFEDGLKKIVPQDLMIKEADIIPDPSYPKYSTRHKSIDFVNLQAPEEVTLKKKKKKKDKHRMKFEFKTKKSSSTESNNFKNEIVIQAEVHHAPEQTTDIEVDSVMEDEQFDPTKPIVIRRKDGTTQATIPVPDFRLPSGWYKHKAFSHNRWQAIIVNSEGKRFFGRKALLKYFRNRNLEFPEDKFFFSYIEGDGGQRKRKPKEFTEKKIKTLSPIVQPAVEKSSPFQDLNSTLDSEGNYTCPSVECGKKFRKENLLMMHLKHYHPEYKNMLPSTLNVADLAYARTNSMDDKEDLPTRQHKKRESGGSTEHLQVPILKLSLTPMKVATPLSPSLPPVSPKIKPESPSIMPAPAEPTIHIEDVAVKENVKPNVSVEDDFESQITQFEITKNSYETKPKIKPNTPVHSTPEKKEPMKPTFTSPPCVKYEKMKKEEVVNCVCGMTEEDGLMIQCDICLCWQHGICFNIESDNDVPEKYICNICKHPPLQRKSFMYSYDQEWLNKGTLPSLDPSKQYDDEFMKTQNILCQSHQLTGSLCKLSSSLHNANIKVQIVQEPNHPKLYLWSHCVKDEEEKDKKVTEGPFIPKPETPIDSHECRVNLLNQVEQDYDLMEQKMNELELQLNALESDSSSLMGNPISDKPTLQMLLRDLETLRTLAIVN